MSIKLIFSRTFSEYPDASRFIDKQLKRGRGCSLVVANDGFVIDVYAQSKTEEKYIIE